MATTPKNPKNAELEAEVLKAGGVAPVDQQDVKDQAQEIAGKAETMQGQPGEGIQMPGSGIPPAATHTAVGPLPVNATADPEYLQFLEWKKQQAGKVEAQQFATAGNFVANKPTPAALHAERLRVYGEGYVVANRQGVEQVFTRQTWKLLGGRNNTDGYREVVSTPPEVTNLNKAQ
jgi:hypothetical protein